MRLRLTFLKDGFGHSLAPLNKLNHLFLGIFLSNTRVLDDHIDHADNGTVENVFSCKRCKIYEKKTRRRELEASLIMARHLKSLKYIGWSTCFFWDSIITEKDNESVTVLDEMAKNMLDDVASAMKTSNFDQGRVEERNIGLTTEFFITRTSTRTTVKRIV
jgi:hypothetical protein